MHHLCVAWYQEVQVQNVNALIATTFVAIHHRIEDLMVPECPAPFVQSMPKLNLCSIVCLSFRRIRTLLWASESYLYAYG